MRFNSAFILGSLMPIITAYQCSQGVSWTPEEFAEYSTLNDTTHWAPMERIKHCYLDKSDLETTHRHKLEARGGRNSFLAFSRPACSGSIIVTVSDFGCGACYTSGVGVSSGRLWRETTANPYPTVDFYSGPNCSGTKIHHQGIFSGQHESCDDINQAVSFVVYQGC